MPEVFTPLEWVLVNKDIPSVFVSMINTADDKIIIQSNDTQDLPDIPPSGIYSKDAARNAWNRLIGWGWKSVK